MKTFTNTDHARLLSAAADSRATDDEKAFLGYMAGLAAAPEFMSSNQGAMA